MVFRTVPRCRTSACFVVTFAKTIGFSTFRRRHPSCVNFKAFPQKKEIEIRSISYLAVIHM